MHVIHTYVEFILTSLNPLDFQLIRKLILYKMFYMQKTGADTESASSDTARRSNEEEFC